MTGFVDGKAVGAVYVVVLPPAFVTVPTPALPPTIPFTSQVTAVPGATHRVAVNDCDCPSTTLAAAGEIELGAAHVIVTTAEADFEVSATLVAVTFTVGGDGGALGAVYVAETGPVLGTSPSVALPPAIPFTLQLTAVEGLPEPVTLAVKTCELPVERLALFGETLTTISLWMVTEAEPLADVSAWLVAVTVTRAGDGMI